MGVGKYFLSCSAGVIDKGKLFVIDSIYKMLLEYNLVDFSYKVLSYNIIPSEYSNHKVVDIYKKQNKLYIILDGSMGNVVEYDLFSDKCKQYIYAYSAIPAFPVDIWHSFFCIDKIYIFPLLIKNGFSVFNTNNNTFERKVELGSDIGSSEEKDLLGRLFFKDDSIYVFPMTRGSIYNMDLKANEIKLYQLPTIRIENIGYYNGSFYISSFADNIISEWDSKYGVTGHYNCEGISRIPNLTVRIFAIYVDKNAILCLPRVGNCLSYINKISREEKLLDLSKYCKRVRIDHNIYFRRGIIVGDRILLLPNEVGNFLWVDMTTGEIESIQSELRTEDIEVAKALNKLRTVSLFQESNETYYEAYFRAVNIYK